MKKVKIINNILNKINNFFIDLLISNIDNFFINKILDVYYFNEWIKNHNFLQIPYRINLKYFNTSAIKNNIELYKYSIIELAKIKSRFSLKEDFDNYISGSEWLFLDCDFTLDWRSYFRISGWITRVCFLKSKWINNAWVNIYPANTFIEWKLKQCFLLNELVKISGYRKDYIVVIEDDLDNSLFYLNNRFVHLFKKSFLKKW